MKHPIEALIKKARKKQVKKAWAICYFSAALRKIIYSVEFKTKEFHHCANWDSRASEASEKEFIEQQLSAAGISIVKAPTKGIPPLVLCQIKDLFFK